MDESLKKLKNDQLVDVIINYKKYKYSEDTRDSAYEILKTRRISREKLFLIAEKYISVNRKIKYTKERLSGLFSQYGKFSLISMIFYSSIILLNIVNIFISEPLIRLIISLLAFVCMIFTYVFHAIAVSKNLVFRSIMDDNYKNDFLNFIIYYFLVLPISPLILIYNVYYMKKSIRNYGN
ncbi:MAG: hypothetical protein EHM28_11175 [Spirochaetaceae bacterium]|nr:MAG: hypothetical protein EHM28_11175 [Spirochaetaceae bacterium]